MMNIWVLENDASVYALVASAFRKASADSPSLRRFKTLNDLWDALRTKELPLPQLLVADMLLLADQGPTLLSDLRTFRPVDFMALSEDPSPAVFSMAIELGTVDYLLKPFTEQRIAAAAEGYFALDHSFAPGANLTQEAVDLYLHNRAAAKSTHKSVKRSRTESRGAYGKRRTPEITPDLEKVLNDNPEGIGAEACAEQMGRSKSYVYLQLTSLVSAGLLKKVRAPQTGHGRPIYLYKKP